jgi:hypothetical protein
VTFFLSFRYETVGGAVRSNPVAWQSDASFAVKTAGISELAKLASGQDVLLGVHGYNNSQSEAVCSLSRLDELLALPSSAIFIGVLWPGDSSFGAISYPVEKPTATAVGRYLAAFCNKALKDSASLSFASHSLGGRVVLEAIRGLNRPARAACLMAAAIERTCLEQEYADAFANCEAVSVLASRRDNVLRMAFPFGNLFGHVLDPSANPLSDALGYAGLARPVGKTREPWQIRDADNYAHGDYLPPSLAAAAFPDPNGKWNRTAQFVRRSFDMQPQTWPG